MHEGPFARKSSRRVVTGRDRSHLKVPNYSTRRTISATFFSGKLVHSRQSLPASYVNKRQRLAAFLGRRLQPSDTDMSSARSSVSAHPRAPVTLAFNPTRLCCREEIPATSRD